MHSWAGYVQARSISSSPLPPKEVRSKKAGPGEEKVTVQVAVSVKTGLGQLEEDLRRQSALLSKLHQRVTMLEARANPAKGNQDWFQYFVGVLLFLLLASLGAESRNQRN